MTNAEIASLFDELGDLLELDGANAFRVRAYRNASRTISDLSDAIADLVEEGANLQELPGIGKDLAQKIVTVVETNELPQLIELKKKIPEGVVAMLRISGLGPKKVAAIQKELGITTLEHLEQAAKDGTVASLKGFGKKTAETILEGLENIANTELRIYLADAKPIVDQIVDDLKKLDAVQQISTAGSSRRLKETVGDLDLLVTADDSDIVMDALADHQLVEKVLARGETKQRVRLKPLVQPMTPGARNFQLEMDLRVVPQESFGAAMQYFTGSKEHNVVLRKRAKDRDMTLNEYGLYKGDDLVAGDTEEAVYAALDLNWVPPEMRENRGEIEYAESNKLPSLLDVADIKADLHMHTTATDGTASISEMAEAAKKRGLKYIAITDHSKRVTMANGLDSERLLAHWEEIRKVNAEMNGIEILCGIECDILEDATLDLPDEVLAEADWVIAVLHYGLKQPRNQINKRLINAIKNPHVHAIGHMTGRLIGKRPPADLSLEEVMKVAADHGVLMEINAHPARLDLNEIHAARAKDLGIPIVINTDTHSTSGFDVLKWGVCQARRAGLTKKDVANTRTLAQFRKLLR